MIRTVVGSAIAVVVLTLVFGFAYPLVMTGFAQVAFQDKANGSLITAKGPDGTERVVGSRQIAQSFTGDEYFWPRLDNLLQMLTQPAASAAPKSAAEPSVVPPGASELPR